MPAQAQFILMHLQPAKPLMPAPLLFIISLSTTGLAVGPSLLMPPQAIIGPLPVPRLLLPLPQ